MTLSSNVNDLASRIATEFNTVRSELLTNGVSQIKHEVKLGEAINKGQAVYVSSANGTNIIVSKASNNGESTSSKTMGLLETSGILNDTSKVITEGLLAGLNTASATAGDPVWLGTSGNLIFGLANKPVAPAHLVFIGIVTRAHATQGEIFVKVQNGFELDELHSVLLEASASIGDNEVLAFDSASGLWKNQTASEAGLAALSGATFTGNISAAKLSIPTVGGDEGGEIYLGPAATNTTLAGGVTIDVYQNKLRIFEQGGDARGAYIDLSAAGNGVSSNLLGGGGGLSFPVTASGLSISEAEFSRLNGVTSNIQTQIDTIVASANGLHPFLLMGA